MRKLIGKLAIAAAAACAVVAQAGAEPLRGPEVRSLVEGKRVYLSTPYGVELPLHYKTDGSVAGDISGISLSNLLVPRETGRWWVKGDELCQKWPSWYDGKTLCFELSRKGGGTITWVSRDGRKGTARIGG